LIFQCKYKQKRRKINVLRLINLLKFVKIKNPENLRPLEGLET
jgi:hypothetical protein